MNRREWLEWLQTSDDLEAREWRAKGFGQRTSFERVVHDLLVRPVEASRLRKRRRSPEFRAKMAALMRERRQDPAFQAHLTASVREFSQRPDYRRLQSNLARARWTDPDYHRKQAELVGRKRELEEDP